MSLVFLFSTDRIPMLPTKENLNEEKMTGAGKENDYSSLIFLEVNQEGSKYFFLVLNY